MNRALACPTCALPYKPEDVHVAERVAVCRACDSVFPISQRQRETVPRPAGWESAEEGGRLVLRHRWLGWHALLFLGWTVLWNAGIVSALQEGAPAPFLLLHGLVGLGVAYFTLCTFVNTSTIRVGRGTLELSHGPLPWFGGVELDTGNIDQLYVEEGSNRKTRFWHVLALCDDGVARKVSPQLTSKAAGRWIEQEIETRLDIADRAVANEA